MMKKTSKMAAAGVLAAMTGDTAALLTVQEQHKAYIGRLSGGNADMQERLNAKLLIAVLKFRLEYQPPRK